MQIPTLVQQPFTFKLNDQNQINTVMKLANHDLSEQKAAFTELGVIVKGKTVTFTDQDQGFELQEDSFVDKGTYLDRKVGRKVEKTTASESLPISWEINQVLPIKADFTPSNLDAARITVIRPLDSQLITIPIDGVGIPKPLGFIAGSTEGGAAEGGHCQINAFRRQMQLAIAVAMGVDNYGIDKIIQSRQNIDHLLHDRGLDAYADAAIAKGEVKNAWEYAETLSPQSQKQRVISYFSQGKALPEIVFTKMLGSGIKSSESKGGKLTAKRIQEELLRINDDKLTNSFKIGGTNLLKHVLMQRQPFNSLGNNIEVDNITGGRGR